MINLRGELEVIGMIDGEIYHYEKQPNIVTKWGKHAVMHLLTGEPFSTHGVQRSRDTNDHTSSGIGEGVNNDGTMMSAEQYFSDTITDDDFFKLAQATTVNTTVGDEEDGNFHYPFFPVKMLFGTGEEWREWDEIPSERQGELEEEGWNQPIFDTNVDPSDSDNTYSNTYSGTGLAKTRSVNSGDFEPKATPALTENETGITGAIKNGLYRNSTEDDDLIDVSTGAERLILENSGIGDPCFIYANRTSRFMQAGANIQLSADDLIENRLTFNVTLPEQTGDNIYYPYNGYLLKEAGLFSDTLLTLGNQIPEPGGNLELYQAHNRMPFGKLIAKRYIQPVQKAPEGSITFRWTIYV